MVIFHVAAPAAVGGLESVVLGLAAGQVQAGHRVHVAVVVHERGEGAPFVAALSAARVEVHEVRVSPRGYLRERDLLERLCRRVGPDVVHTHGFRPDVVDGPVARRLGIPTVTTVHGHNHAGTRERVSEWFQHRSFRRFAAVVAVSRPLVERLRRSGVEERRIHLVPNACRNEPELLPAAEARRLLVVPPGSWHVGWVGRMESVKGPDVFVDALDFLRDLPLAATLVGDGSLRRGLEAHVLRSGLAARVRWTGEVPMASRYLSAFDAVVLSSRMEGTPMVLLEAMAAGIPVVATEVGGVPDVVSPVEALLVPPLRPRVLADAIRSVFQDPRSAHRRAAAARARLARCFGQTSWLQRYEKIYRDIQLNRARSAS